MTEITWRSLASSARRFPRFAATSATRAWSASLRSSSFAGSGLLERELPRFDALALELDRLLLQRWPLYKLQR